MSKVEKLVAEQGETERGLADLRTRREGLAAELEEAQAQSAGSDFVTFVRSGEIATDVRAPVTVQGEMDRVDAMIAAGEQRLDWLASDIKTAKRDAHAAWVASLTLADAITFAGEALEGIDVEGARGELQRIEDRIGKLHEPRLEARQAAEQAAVTEANLLQRYRGRPDPKSGLTLQEARAARDAAIRRVNDLRDNVRSLQRRHEHQRAELRGAVAAGLAHVGRLTAASGERLEKVAAQIATFGRAVAADRPMFPVLPDLATVDLPTPGQIADLRARAEPALALARRAPPPEQPEAIYSPRALR